MSIATSELERRTKAAKEELAHLGETLAGMKSLGEGLRAVADSIKEVMPVSPVMTNDQVAAERERQDQEDAERGLLNLFNDVQSFMLKLNDGIKGRLGAPSVRSFMKEVRTKLQTMIDGLPKAVQEKMADRLAGVRAKVEELEEAARAFEVDCDLLPDECFALIEDGGEKDAEGKTTPRSLRHGPYKGADGKVHPALLRASLGDVLAGPLTESQRAAARATLLYAARANNIEIELRETGASRGAPVSIEHRATLREAAYDAKRGELTVVLIEAGTNQAKRRHYPEATIREAAPHFAGLKMYLNHPTPSQAKERPERDIRDWASTITESHYDGGKAVGKIAVHASFLRELLEDPVARKHIGISINTQGVSEDAMIDGQRMQVVKQIVVEKGEHGRKSSVDWVTEAGARGRVLEVLESRRTDTMALETIQLSDLKAERPDLVETIRAEAEKETKAKVEKEVKGKMDGEIKEAMGKIDARVTGVEGQLKRSQQENVIRKELGKTKLPQQFQEKIVEALSGQSYEKPEQLTEAIASKVKEAVELIRSTGFKVSDDGGTAGAGGGSKSLIETLGEQLDERAGTKAKDEGKDKGGTK